MNAIFGLKVRISIGERTLIGTASGSAVFLSPLPSPSLPKLVSDRDVDDKKIAHLQKSLHDIVKKNIEIYQIKHVSGICTRSPVRNNFLQHHTSLLFNWIEYSLIIF